MNAPSVSNTDDFVADLRKSLAVWSRQPLLPILSAVVWAAPALPPQTGLWSAAGLVWSVFFIGWPGTEREWYRRAFAGEAFQRSEIWKTVGLFRDRFFRLGLIAAPLVIFWILFIVLFRADPYVVGASSLILIFVVDVVATFITPALTFTTRSSVEAIKIGVAMLRTEWRAAMPYALTPALVLVLGARLLLEPSSGPANTFLADAIAVLVALAMKGATVAFYLRRRPVTAP